MRVALAQTVAGGTLTKFVTISPAYADTNYVATPSITSSDYVLFNVTGKETNGYTVSFEANPDTLTFDSMAMR